MSARLTMSVSSDAGDVQAVRAALGAFAAGRGATSDEASLCASVVGDIAEWVAQTCFPAPVTGTIGIELTAAEDGLHAVISDDGIPQPAFGSGLGPTPPELSGIHAVVTDLHRITVAGSGKTIRLLVPTRLREEHEAVELQQIDASPAALNVRLARPEDASDVGRVIHAVYGVIYSHAEFYDQDQLVASWQRGDIVSAVATYDGMVVAHAALFREPGGEVLELGAVAVDPRFRRLGLGGLVCRAVVAEGVAMSAPAVSSHIVTTHTGMQSLAAAMGLVITGLLVGAAPAQAPGHPRQTLLLAYLPVARAPRRVAFPSELAYAEALAYVYGQLGLDLEPQDADAALAELGDAAGVEMGPASQDGSPAVITIRRYGPEEHRRLVDALRDAATSGAAVVYVDLDLHTLTQGQLDEIRAFLSHYDFFAAGLLLHGGFGHDHLRVQAMLSRDLQLEHIVLLTEEARAVRAAVFNDHSKLALRVHG